MDKPNAPSCERNREPIHAVLRAAVVDKRQLLEIGSGTGQHAAFFAGHFPQLIWQTSDRPENLPGIQAWLADANLPNTPAPHALDVAGTWPDDKYDVVFTANTLHIMAWSDVEQLFARLPAVTTPRAILIAYGPFNYAGRFSSESNAAFDQSLRERAGDMGIRDAEAVDQLANRAGFTLIDDVAMPANNRCRLWQRTGG